MSKETDSSGIGNDLALVSFHLTKLKLGEMREVLIYIENILKDSFQEL